VKVILFGATGMVGAGVLAECLEDARVRSVLIVGRSTSGVGHPKVRERLREDLFHYRDLLPELGGHDACFFCVGVSSLGMDEAAYTRISYDLTIAAAEAVAAASPGLTFCYVSGEGTDRTGEGRAMWARVKGRTENRLLEMEGLDAYMFRPGYIQPRKGIRSKTRVYRTLYAALSPFYPVLRRLAPSHVTTTENVGRAMIEIAASGYGARILENRDINELGAARLPATNR
jgi:uncharacterized protein YbjT (DUF2867 family)